MGADAKIGLGRVIEWIDGTNEIRVEMIGEDGYHIIATYKIDMITTLPTPLMEECRRIANMPPIATYRSGPAGKRPARA